MRPSADNGILASLAVAMKSFESFNISTVIKLACDGLPA